MPKVDMTGELGGQFEVIPRGRYRVYVTGASTEVSKSVKNPGKTFTHWEFTISDGQYTNRKIWGNTMHFGKGRGMLRDLLVATGEYTAEQVEVDEFEFEYEDVIGLQLVIGVKVKPETEEYAAGNDVNGFYTADTETTEEKGAENNSMMPN